MFDLQKSPIFYRTRKMKNTGLLLAVGTACIGPLVFGFTIGYSSPAIPSLEKEKLMTSTQASWFGSLLTIGAIFGGPLGGWIIGQMGRQKGLLATFVPFVLGFLLISVSGGKHLLLYLGRVLTGLASGMTIVCTPVYIAETSTKNLRGFLGTMTQLSITVGILLAYSCGMWGDWKALGIFGVTMPCIGAVMTVILKVPETPRWLVMNKKKAEAIRSLEKLRGFPVDVEDECRDIEESIDPNEEFNWKELKKWELFQPLRLSICMMIFQQFSGINVVVFYAGSIFADAGFRDKSNEATIVIGIVQVVATVFASLFMDRAGRRALLSISSFGMAVSCFMLAYYYNHMDNMEWLALVSLVCYIIFFSLGWGPIPMLLMSEIFPARARSTASAIAVTSNWICAFVITKEFNALKELLGESGAFILFGFICLLGLGYVFKYVPETKGKSLEDIELYFLGRAIRNV